MTDSEVGNQIQVVDNMEFQHCTGNLVGYVKRAMKSGDCGGVN